LGNVLFGFDYMRALERIKDKVKVAPEDIFKKIYDDNFSLPFEKGIVSARQFYQEFKRQFAADIGYQEFRDIWCDIFYPQKDVIDLAAVLKKNYRLYLISNINELHFDFLYRDYPDVFSLFDALILSFQLKSVKPEAAMYHALQQAAGVAFDRIIYIDDRDDLLRQAHKFRLRCIQFKNYPQLIKELQGLGIQCS